MNKLQSKCASNVCPCEVEQQFVEAVDFYNDVNGIIDLGLI